MITFLKLTFLEIESLSSLIPEFGLKNTFHLVGVKWLIAAQGYLAYFLKVMASTKKINVNDELGRLKLAWGCFPKIRISVHGISIFLSSMKLQTIINNGPKLGRK